MTPEILHPSIQPFTKYGESFFDTFTDLIGKSDELMITSGYISEDAIEFLKINLKQLPRFNLAIGMHGIEGFTRSQYENLVELNSLMVNKNKGLTFVSDTLKFHGKAYSFLSDNSPFASIVGSTNISILGDKDKRQFEIDVLLNDQYSIQKVHNIQKELINYSVTIDQFKPQKFIETNKLEFLEPYTNSKTVSVEKIDTAAQNILVNTATNLQFILPLKCEAKSSMNVAFGKGRENTSNKIVIPRSWLEFEIIVGVDITRKKGYPTYSTFWVITDDGWKFKVNTQGGNSKNLRSLDDLKVLGAWVKGRLLNSGAVKYGQFINETDLTKFGKKNVSLTKLKTTIENIDVYYLEFK